MSVLSTFQTYTFTSDEDEILTQMLTYFGSMGLPEDWNQEAFDSMFEKVFNPRLNTFTPNPSSLLLCQSFKMKCY